MALNMRLSPTTPLSYLIKLFPKTSTNNSTNINTTSKSMYGSNRQKPMTNLPPTSNPRGELVFSHKVDKSFRDGYERYRAAFERKRSQTLASRSSYSSPWITNNSNNNINTATTVNSKPLLQSNLSSNHSKSESFSFLLNDQSNSTTMSTSTSF